MVVEPETAEPIAMLVIEVETPAVPILIALVVAASVAPVPMLYVWAPVDWPKVIVPVEVVPPIVIVPVAIEVPIDAEAEEEPTNEIVLLAVRVPLVNIPPLAYKAYVLVIVTLAPADGVPRYNVAALVNVVASVDARIGLFKEWIASTVATVPVEVVSV